MRIVGPAEHDEPGPVGDLVVIGGQRMLDGVLGAQIVHAHHHAGQAAAESHLLPGLYVLPVLAGGGQVPAHGLNGPQGQHVPHQVIGVVDVGLRGVEEGVKPLVSGKLGGHGEHKVRVHDGEDREGVLVAAAHLLLGFLVGHHGPGIQLRPGAGGGGNGHNGQGLVLHLFAAAGAAVHVVPVIALIGGHHGNGLGRVDAAAAAQAQDKVTAVGPGAGRAVHHIVQDGVGQNLVKHGVGHPGLGQLVLHNVQVAVGPGGFAAGNDDQGMLARQTLLVQLLDRALAKDQVGGNVERKAHGSILLSVFHGRQNANFTSSLYHGTLPGASPLLSFFQNFSLKISFEIRQNFPLQFPSPLL